MQWAQVQKHGLVSRKEKDSRSAVFRISKGYEAAEAALRGSFATLRFTYIYGQTETLLEKRKACFGTMLKVLNTTLAIECGATKVASQGCLFGKTTEVLSGTELLARQTGD